MSTELDDRIRATVHTIAHSAPDPVPWPGVSVPRNAPEPMTPRRSRRNLVSVAAALALTLSAGGVALAIRQDSPETAATRPGTVIHSVFEFSQSSHACPPSHGRGPFDVDRARIDTWYDQPRARYRRSQTYAGGSTFDQIFLGISEHPSADFTIGRAYSRGTSRIAPSCAGPISGQVLPKPWASASSPNRVGRAVAGTITDSRGRPAWRRRSAGTRTLTVGNSGTQLARETTIFFMRPHTGELLEIQYQLSIPTVGVFTSRLVTVRQDRIDAPRSLFSTRSYRPVYIVSP